MGTSPGDELTDWEKGEVWSQPRRRLRAARPAMVTLWERMSRLLIVLLAGLVDEGYNSRTPSEPYQIDVRSGSSLPEIEDFRRPDR
jgi:hypothetical protein